MQRAAIGKAADGKIQDSLCPGGFLCSRTSRVMAGNSAHSPV
jgi:hypothetical protein